MDEREFYGCRIQWNQHVLIPRQESEILVLYTLQRLEKEPAGVFVDLCTGSGCLGLAVKKARPIFNDFSRPRRK